MNVLLILFAFVAGAGTAITPCVLPVLPALLSAGALGRPSPPGRRRARAGADVHDHDRRARSAGQGRRARRRRGAHPRDRRADRRSGVVLLVPELADRVQAPLSRLARFGPAGARGRVLVGRRGRRARSGSCARRARGRSWPRSSPSAPRAATSCAARARRLAYALGLGACCCCTPSAAGRCSRGCGAPARGHVVERALGAVLLAHRRRDGHERRRPLRGGAGQARERRRSSSTRRRRSRTPTRCRTGSRARPASRFAERQREASPRRRPRTAGVAIPGSQTPRCPTLGAGTGLHRQRAAGSTRRAAGR